MGLLDSVFSFLPLFLLSGVPLAIAVFLINRWGEEVKDSKNTDNRGGPSH